ncbi:MAG: phosphate acyltransferase PlsX [Nitrospinota bacterium]
MKIAVDAMGGDNAPSATVEGAVLAARELGVTVRLIGIEDAVNEELARHQTAGLGIEVINASQLVEMDESPALAYRKKKDSSIMVGLNMLKSGSADAFVSAGNTGAVMAAGSLILRRMPGLSRAAIAVMLPTGRGWSILIDAGANVDCKPRTLFEFGLMGSIYASHELKKDNPVVSILSIGEEETKGNEITKEAAALLKASALNFNGNIEAKEVYQGNADVIVCDGFVGNISLKISESLAEMISGALREIFSRNLRSKLGYLLVKPYLEEFKKRVDHSEYGGAPLLGLNGAVIISHGSSSAKAIKNAVMQAERFTRMGVMEKINKALKESSDIIGQAEKKDGFWRQIKKSIQFEPPAASEDGGDRER